MGVLNVTPDSFSDGGDFVSVDVAVSRALEMISEGAAIIDIGGESTRPGATPVEAGQEMGRVLPVIEALASECDTVISIDTMKPEVMSAAVAAGAHLVNDVNALRTEGAVEAVAETTAAVCLMHMQGEPRTMQSDPVYEDVVRDVSEFLSARAAACEEAGISRDRILIDPGFGFGKTLEHNLQLMRSLGSVCELPWPLLVGVSRKSMLGALLDLPPKDRVHGGIAAAALACWQGAKVIRTHDVQATVEALKVVTAVHEQG